MATSLSHGLSHAPVRCQHSLPHSRTSCLVTRHTPSHYITLWPLGAIQGHQHTTIHYLYPAQHCIGSVLFELRTYVTLSDLLPVYNIIKSDIKTQRSKYTYYSHSTKQSKPKQHLPFITILLKVFDNSIMHPTLSEKYLIFTAHDISVMCDVMQVLCKKFTWGYMWQIPCRPTCLKSGS